MTTEIDPAKLTQEQYELIAARRQSYDELMWQTPVLSLTAQAFLFTIALAHDSTQTARLISAVLAVLTSVASVQLMKKHRALEVRCSNLVRRYEESKELPQIHARPTIDGDFLERQHSHKVWIALLGAFGLAGVCVIVIAIWIPNLL